MTVLLALLAFVLSRWWTERDAKNKEIAALRANNERFKNALGLVVTSGGGQLKTDNVT